MNVIIANSVALNGGDAAILHAILKLLEATFGPGQRVTIFDGHAEVAAKYFPELEFRASFSTRAPKRAGVFAGKRRWLDRRFARHAHVARLLAAAKLLADGFERAARALCSESEFERLERFRTADLVISTGGTYLVPTYRLGGRLLELGLAHVFRVPLVLYTQSIGSFSGHPNRRALAWCLERARLVLLRDERSLDNVRGLGLDGKNCRVSPDVVFSMAEDALLSRARPRRLVDRDLLVVVSVRDWPHFEGGASDQGMERYKQAVARAVTELVRTRGARVVFLSTCQGIPEYSYDDARVGQAVMALVPEPERSQVSVDAGHHTPQELLSRLSEADLLIATRMHMAILGLCAGTPVLPIAYEFKTAELFRKLGFADWVEAIDTVTESSLTERVEHVLAEGDARRAELMAAVATCKREASSAMQDFPTFLHRVSEG